MSQSHILVTGATGKTGAAVVAQLRERGMPVRALVHSRDRRSAALDQLGAETVVADLFDPDQIAQAMRGIARAYYCPPFHPYMVQSATAFAIAARDANLESVVTMSQWLASPSHPSLATRQHWLVDRVFAALPGIGLTIVNPGFFADNYLRLIDFASQLGILPSVTGDSRNAPVANEDIARVIVAALLDPARHAGRTYRPTGPALLSTSDMAKILGTVLDRNVRRLEMPMWLFTKAARRQGTSAFLMSGFRHYVQDHLQGAFELGGPTDDVHEVTGRPAERFEATARRYAARPEAARSFGNAVRTFAGFLWTPLAPGYDLERHDRLLDFPAPPKPRFALQDTHWKSARVLQSRQWSMARAFPSGAGA